MEHKPKRIAFGMLGLALAISCAAGGCVELKYSARNRLSDPVDIRSSAAVKAVYFSFQQTPLKNEKFAEYFPAALKKSIEKKGMVFADEASGADIVINANTLFYRKAQGTFLFILIFPVYRFTEDYDGISLDISYKTDQGQWRKNYRAYYRGWLVDELETASDLLVEAVIKDISPASQGVSQQVDKSQ
jgi:hypothetical protein